MLLSSNWRNEAIAPGKLSVHHAQLVTRGGDSSNRCASCHAAGNQSAFEWLSHATDPKLSTPTQSELCLECHKKDIPPATALLAHNFDPQFLTATHEVDLGARHVDPSGSFACATCHQEHHGASHDLKAMSDSACQACHRQEFHSFATDHPDFKTWPEKRRTRIAFDHSSHQAKHFPAEKQEFACATCHQQSESGFQETLGYEATCAKCHDSDIQTSWEAGVPFVNLPMVDVEALAEAGHDVKPWPEATTGDFDGALPLVTKFLLLSDADAAQGIEILGTDFDFYDVDPDDPEQLAAAAKVILAVKQMTTDIAAKGHSAIAERLEKILSRKLTAEELAAAVAHLSAEDMSALAESWLAESPAEASGQPGAKEKFAGGGWVRDDQTFALRYRPTGHADPWLTAWITYLAESTSGPQKKNAESLLTQIMKPTAPGMCGSCHSVDRLADGSLAVNWIAKQSTTKQSFTVFSHAPHVLQTQLSDCSTCHRLEKEAAVMTSYTAQDPRTFAAGFHQFTKQDCATCHKDGAAGDSCTQCHRYHIGER